MKYMLSDVCVWFDIMAHISVPCLEGPPATKGHFSSEPAVAGRGRYYCTSKWAVIFQSKWYLRRPKRHLDRGKMISFENTQLIDQALCETYFAEISK